MIIAFTIKNVFSIPEELSDDEDDEEDDDEDDDFFFLEVSGACFIPSSFLFALLDESDELELLDFFAFLSPWRKIN